MNLNALAIKPPRGSELNGMRNGTRVNWRRLAIGELPDYLKPVENTIHPYRRRLEVAVLDKRGEIDEDDAAAIAEATDAALGYSILTWLLRATDQKSHSDVRGIISERHKMRVALRVAVKALDLRDSAPADPWLTLTAPTSAYATPIRDAEPASAQPAANEQNAPTGHVGPQDEPLTQEQS